MSAANPSILICGLGSIGKRHLTNLMALGQRNLILHRRTAKPLTGDEFGSFQIETDLSAALKLKPDAIIVSNPTALHLPVAIAGARAGCHVLLEKPISHNAIGADTLREEITQNRLACLVGFQLRFHPTIRQIKRWLETESIGRVVSAHVHWGEYLPDWHSDEDYRSGYSARADLGGGVILTLCHPFDYLRWLLGEIESVFAATGQLSGLELDVEDTAKVTLRFTSGVIGSVSLDYVQRPPHHTLNIVGDRGTIEWDATSGVAQLYDVEKKSWTKSLPPPEFERNTMFVDEMKHFLNCVEGKETPICTLDDGLQSLKVCLAAKRSSVERREVIV